MFKATNYKHPLVLMGLFQMLFLFGAFLQFLLQHPLQPGERWIQNIIFGAIATSIILTFFIIGSMFKSYEKEALLATKEALAHNFTSLAESLKIQNQEFIYHIKEISSLFRNNQVDALSQYLENLYGKISFLNNVLKVDNAIIGALLNAKISEADTKRIKLEIDITTSLNTLDTKALDVARITGNLIDNAFDALDSLEISQRNILLEISRVGPLLKLEVSNPGPVIDRVTVQQIFQPGYTTKGEEHSGLGLYIVKTLAEKLQGTVEVFSNETKGTKFVVILPGL